MGKFQIIVLLSVVTCAIISTVQSVPVSDSSVESENTVKCKNLCGFCGCTGYYCGDECICECNSLTDGKAECVDTMKSNCKKLELPFEVLIQGPNVNRMVRSLLYTDTAEDTCESCELPESNQKKRSTISIYKPDGAFQQKDAILTEPAALKVEETHDSSIPIIVVPKSDTEVDQIEIEQVDQEATCSLKSPSPDADRTNIKRHVIDAIDVNQDISEFNKYSADSFLFKRDAEKDKEEKKDEEKVPDETVAAPAAPTAPVVPAPIMPKIYDAIEHMKAQIPTDAEIRGAWEGVRKELNTRINSAIADAKKRATELRHKITSPPPHPASPVPVVPAKFNPFLRSENEEHEVGMALVPAVPLIPVVPALASLPLQAEIAKNIAATRAAAIPIQTEIAKHIANFRINNKLNQENARAQTRELINSLTNNRWLVNPSLVRNFK